MGAPSEPDPARDLADAALEAARALGPELLPEDLEVEVRSRSRGLLFTVLIARERTVVTSPVRGKYAGWRPVRLRPPPNSGGFGRTFSCRFKVPLG